MAGIKEESLVVKRFRLRLSTLKREKRLFRGLTDYYCLLNNHASKLGSFKLDMDLRIQFGVIAHPDGNRGGKKMKG